MNTHISLRRLSPSAISASACIALALAMPLTARADPPAPRTATLHSTTSLSDLDLSTKEGMRAAEKRLRRKAEHLCRQLGDSASATDRWTYAACVRETFADAMQQLNGPAVAAIERPPGKP